MLKITTHIWAEWDPNFPPVGGRGIGCVLGHYDMSHSCPLPQTHTPFYSILIPDR